MNASNPRGVQSLQPSPPVKRRFVTGLPMPDNKALGGEAGNGCVGRLRLGVAAATLASIVGIAGSSLADEPRAAVEGVATPAALSASQTGSNRLGDRAR